MRNEGEQTRDVTPNRLEIDISKTNSFKKAVTPRIQTNQKPSSRDSKKLKNMMVVNKDLNQVVTVSSAGSFATSGGHGNTWEKI